MRDLQIVFFPHAYFTSTELNHSKITNVILCKMLTEKLNNKSEKTQVKKDSLDFLKHRRYIYLR